MSRATDVERAIEAIEAKQKELCPVGMYGRNYVYGSDREKYDAWEEIIDALNNLPTFTPQDEWVSVDDRLPDVGDLVVYADRIAWGYQYGIRRISKDDRVLRKERSFYFWMPLPEPTDKGDEQ